MRFLWILLVGPIVVKYNGPAPVALTIRNAMTEEVSPWIGEMGARLARLANFEIWRRERV